MIPLLMISSTSAPDELPQWAKGKRPVKIKYYLGLGTSFPTGDLDNYWNRFLHGFSRIDFSASPVLNVWAGVDYHTFKPEVEDEENLKFKCTNLVFDLKLNLGNLKGGFNPYFFAGTGLSITNLRITPNQPKTYPLLEIGVGGEFEELFIQGRYLSVLSNNTAISYIPITLGMKF